MKTRQKGNRIQRKLINKYKVDGWLIDKVEKTGRFNKEKDLFGLFDLIAIKNGFPISLVQVTTNKCHSHKLFKGFASRFSGVSCSVVQSVWYDRKGWVHFQYFRGGKVVKLDRRVK